MRTWLSIMVILFSLAALAGGYVSGRSSVAPAHNDVYGHRVGDQVLKAVSQRLKDALRRVDLTARLGGDEFAIIVEDLTSQEQADQICDTVGKLLEAPLLIDNTAMPLGISVGCSVVPQDGTSVDQLLHTADLRMYATKEAHKRGEDPLAMKAPRLGHSTEA